MTHVYLSYFSIQVDMKAAFKLQQKPVSVVNKRSPAYLLK